MKENLKKYIARYVDLEGLEFESFYSLMNEKQYAKKEFLLNSGSVCKYQYFIVQGLIRSFYIDNQGVERIVQFGIENWWVTNIDSFSNQKPSEVHIQALEPTTALLISKESLEMAYSEIPKIERLFRLISEKTLIAQQRNSHFYMKETSKDRYYGLIKTIPNFAQRVPQYMIASYLDITPEYLSDLRNSS